MNLFCVYTFLVETIRIRVRRFEKKVNKQIEEILRCYENKTYLFKSYKIIQI